MPCREDVGGVEGVAVDAGRAEIGRVVMQWIAGATGAVLDRCWARIVMWDGADFVLKLGEGACCAWL